MNDLIKRILNIKSIITFIFGIIIGILTMYYGFIEKLDVIEIQINNLLEEDANTHDVLHLHYKKLLKLE